MDLSYQCGLKDAHLCTREELRAFYREELLHDRKEDIQRGSTAAAPSGTIWRFWSTRFPRACTAHRGSSAAVCWL